MAAEECACGCGKPRPLYVFGHDRRDFLGHTVEDRGHDTPCWISTKKSKPGRYLLMRVDGKQVGLHRVAFEHAHGPIPDGHHIDHLCRVTHCINPTHLEAVLPRENVRRSRGTKVTPELVIEIRKSAEPNQQIAERLNLSHQLISLIRRRQLWQEVSPDVRHPSEDRPSEDAHLAYAKLTPDLVRAIRASNERVAVLAERFGVSTSTIYHVRSRLTWPDLV